MAATPLNIDDPEAFELAREIAEQTGRNVTQVVVDALRREKQCLPQRLRPAELDELKAILARIQALPDLDPRPSKELFDELYDEWGLPT